VFGIVQIGVSKLSKILHYNYSSVIDKIKKGEMNSISPYISKDFSIDLFNKYEKFGLHRNAVYDRSEAIPHYLNMSSSHPMPFYDPNFNKSFYEIAEERAKELIDLNLAIRVCWSGGIDSTFVLLMLSKFAAKNQIIVYGSYASIIESGDVFDKFIKQKFNYKIQVYPNKEMKRDTTGSILVTGYQGNQLFGPTDNFFASERQVAFFHHTMGTKETIYEDYRKHVNPELLEFLQPAIDRSPKKIETICDLRWYCIFNMDWYNGLYFMKSEMSEDAYDNTYHFFDTEDFQKWAIHTKEPFTKIKGDPNTHRWQMREFIADCGLVDYSKNKSKAISNFCSNEGHWLFLLDNLENIYAN